ncbi:MAG TPA: DUF3558 family protein [Candidatus Angelobacter sp.]|nr:DUF3558 family protein [Candidatus Angelobacter sp.]
MSRILMTPASCALAFSLLLCSCSGSPSSGAGTSSSTPAAPSNSSAQPQSSLAGIDPCSKFTAADAQAIMGVPMKLSRGQGSAVCMYEETSPKAPATSAKVSLSLNVRSSAAEEDRAWNNIKVIHRFMPGEKNVTQLSGNGDEAWFDGHIQDGKVDTGGVLGRKGALDFALISTTIGYRASADEIKKIAKRIADELP